MESRTDEENIAVKGFLFAPLSIEDRAGIVELKSFAMEEIVSIEREIRARVSLFTTVVQPLVLRAFYVTGERLCDSDVHVRS